MPHAEDRAGRQVTSLPSVAAIVPPPPISTPSSAPFTPPMMPPMIAPTAEPAPIRPASPLMPSLSIASSPCRASGSCGRDGNLIERHGEAALAVGSRRPVHRADDAAHHRTGGNQHLVALYESTTVVASNRSSTCAVSDVSSVCSRTSISWPAGMPPFDCRGAAIVARPLVAPDLPRSDAARVAIARRPPVLAPLREPAASSSDSPRARARSCLNLIAQFASTRSG